MGPKWRITQKKNGENFLRMTHIFQTFVSNAPGLSVIAVLSTLQINFASHWHFHRTALFNGWCWLDQTFGRLTLGVLTNQDRVSWNMRHTSYYVKSWIQCKNSNVSKYKSREIDLSLVHLCLLGPTWSVGPMFLIGLKPLRHKHPKCVWRSLFRT